MINSYLDSNFEFIEKADITRYTNGIDMKLVNLEPIALFHNFELTLFSGKHVEDISHTHIVSSMYNLITSDKDTEDLSIGSDRVRKNRPHELPNNKNIRSKYHVRITLKDVLGFAEHQEKSTYGLG